ncbi:MAG: endodeoxyribonuclease [Pseudomonadota bacterium]
MKPKTARKQSPRQRAIAAGYRSGLEDATAQHLTKKGVQFEYETRTIYYEKPARLSRYTPDFLLPNGIIVETKGRFVTADRQKMLLIKKQHPDLDIRMVFSNPNTRISKTSKTTYAMWCNRHGFQFEKLIIPAEWIAEPENSERFKALEKAGIKP